MPKIDFEEAVEQIVKRDPRFAREAYAHVRECLNHTFREVSKKRGDRAESGHLRGPEILQGFRSYSIQQFGPMVPTILEDWGIRTTRNVGEIIFNLIDEGVFSRSEDDSIEDFADGFDFNEAFIRPFLPAKGAKVAAN